MLLVLTAVTLLLAPVDYRAGADAPHPHAVVQLLVDVAQERRTHHHADQHRPHAHAVSEPRGPDHLSPAAEPDIAGSSAATPTTAKAAVLLLAGAGAPLTIRERPSRSAPVRLTGRRLQPDPPPPRVDVPAGAQHTTGLFPHERDI